VIAAIFIALPSARQNEGARRYDERSVDTRKRFAVDCFMPLGSKAILTEKNSN
jgi:hypothetical protein